jgi:polar amino acid transport system substrate-binding protein
MRAARRFLCPLIAGGIILTATSRSAESTQPKAKLVVAVYDAPPFDIRQADGSWTGLSIDLWRRIASDLKLDYAFREVDLAGRFTGLSEGWIDVAVGPNTITPQREENVDFTHSYFASGLAIAVPMRGPGGATQFGAWPNLLYRTFVSWEFLKVTSGLLALLLVMSVLMWLCEHQKNPAEFGGRGWQGIGSSLWWSAVTMTGVGYGDLTPKSWIGRLIAVFWMFASLLLVAGFTASMASMLTAEQLATRQILKVDDLHGVKIGAISDSIGAQYLEARHLHFRAYASSDLLEALRRGRIQAAVDDAALLLYEAQTRFRGEIKVLPLRFNQGFYGFAVQEGSPLREQINRVLLRVLVEPAWKDLVRQYLGTPD